MEIGKLLISIGFVILIIGLVLSYFKEAIQWFGNLPGDFKWEGNHTKIYIPLMSMLLLSILLNLIYYIFKHLKH
ncbi:MAG: DUF2905 domain-containing protein [Saprospiraceae bacterium]|nr:DUF2905 domain-containing protein [Saprospiraceae bacterium]HRG68630.1 DUF2905 family protein [Saprospiraceae bacterium]